MRQNRFLLASVALAAALLCPALTHAQRIDPRPDAEQMGLKGKVKRMTEYGMYDDVLQAYKTYTFDQRGFLLQEVDDYTLRRLQQGQPTYTDDVRKEYTYRADGQLEACRSYGGDGQLTGYTAYSYSQAGLLVKETFYDAADQEQMRFDYTYNADGTLKAFTCYYEGSADYAYTSELQYQDGRLVHSEAFRTGRVPYTICDLDGMDRPTEFKEFKPDGRVRMHHRYTYDAQGRQVTQETEDDGSWFTTDRYAYDEHGEQVYVESRYVTEPDRVSIFRTQYTYDAHGNWTQKRKLADEDIEVDYAQRAIEYYE